MSDVFFIVSTICVAILTLLLGILLYKIISVIDEVNATLEKAKVITNAASKIASTFASVGTFVSPVAGVMKKVIKRKRRRNAREE